MSRAIKKLKLEKNSSERALAILASVDHPSQSLRSDEPALQALLLNFNSISPIHPARLVHHLRHLQLFLRQSGLKPKTMKYLGRSRVPLLSFL